jgi:hypothetical protein
MSERENHNEKQQKKRVDKQQNNKRTQNFGTKSNEMVMRAATTQPIDLTRKTASGFVSNTMT